MGFTLSLLRLSPQFLNSYNQLLPLYLRIPSCRCRPALCLAGPLVAVGARVVRWAVARAGCLGAGARGGGWRVAVLWAISPYPSPPNCLHCRGRLPPSASLGSPPPLSRSCRGSARGVCACRGLLGWRGDRLAGGGFWERTLLLHSPLTLPLSLTP